MPCRPLTETEAESVLNQLSSPRDRCLFILGLRTGFRISELLSLRVGDVGGDYVTVARCNMKGKHSSRTIPLHSQAKAAISVYIGTMNDSVGADVRLFGMTRQHANRILKRAVIKAKLQGKISSHSMRKTFGMKVYEATGKDIVAAQRALGHKSLASTTHYLSVNDDVITKAILS